MTGCWLHCIVEAMVTPWHNAYSSFWLGCLLYRHTHLQKGFLYFTSGKSSALTSWKLEAFVLFHGDILNTQI